MPDFRFALLLTTLCSTAVGLLTGLKFWSADVAIANIPVESLNGGRLRIAIAEPQAEPETAKKSAKKANPLKNDSPKVTEAEALQTYQRAADLANQAVIAFESAKVADSRASQIELIRREQFLWESALKALATIPDSSTLYERATLKQIHYKQLLSNAKQELAKKNQGFIVDIIQEANTNPSGVHVTLCHLNTAVPVPEKPAQQITEEHCRHHQGDQPLASPASLIKVPIALVLVQKAKSDSTLLDQKILIDPGNFTENAAGPMIEVGNEYSLRKVMGHMISGSDNIATNQLIDYLGYDQMEAVLSRLGYQQTSIGHKLAGDRVMAENFGTGLNQTTSDDITAMMMQIYRSDAPGDKDILTALTHQFDRELGYEALKNVGSNVKWIGEKTGQNADVLASTLTMSIGSEKYVLTVALDNSGDIQAMQQIIHGIANHVSKAGF